MLRRVEVLVPRIGDLVRDLADVDPVTEIVEHRGGVACDPRGGRVSPGVHRDRHSGRAGLGDQLSRSGQVGSLVRTAGRTGLVRAVRPVPGERRRQQLARRRGRRRSRRCAGGPGQSSAPDVPSRRRTVVSSRWGRRTEPGPGRRSEPAQDGWSPRPVGPRSAYEACARPFEYIGDAGALADVWAVTDDVRVALRLRGSRPLVEVRVPGQRDGPMVDRRDLVRPRAWQP